MRILMVAPQPFFRPRGTPFSVLHRIRGLLRLGHTVDLVTYPFGDSPSLPGLTIHRAARPPGVRDVSIGPSVTKLLLDLPVVIKTYRLARTRKFDLLHTHEEAGALCSWIARLCRMPHLYDMHSSLPEQFSNFDHFNYWPVVATFRELEKYTLSRADAVIAICPELYQHVLASGYRGSVAMIENCLDFDPPDVTDSQVESLRERLGLGSVATVVYTGTLELYQGLESLIRAVVHVREQSLAARFLIVGGTKKQIARLKNLASALQVESDFVFVPAVSPIEVFSYLRLADILVTTRTRGTNTPLKLYQYLRAGKPIVATDIRAHTQVLSHENAELVPATAEGISGGLVRVLKDPVHAGVLAEAAQKLSREEYSEESYLARLRSLLEKITSRSQRTKSQPHLCVE